MSVKVNINNVLCGLIAQLIFPTNLFGKLESGFKPNSGDLKHVIAFLVIP